MKSPKHDPQTDLDAAKARKFAARQALDLHESRRSVSASQSVAHVQAESEHAEAAYAVDVAQWHCDRQTWETSDVPRETRAFVAALPASAAAIDRRRAESTRDDVMRAERQVAEQIDEQRSRHNAWCKSAGIRDRRAWFPSLGGTVAEQCRKLAHYFDAFADEPPIPPALENARRKVQAAKAAVQSEYEAVQAERARRAELEAEQQQRDAVAARARAQRVAAHPPVDHAALHRAEQERLAAAYDQRVNGGAA